MTMGYWLSHDKLEELECLIAFCQDRIDPNLIRRWIEIHGKYVSCNNNLNGSGNVPAQNAIESQ